MDKKKYNQMGFDFGDADPAQESPAAGFRIKSLKPASQADTGETNQETDNQENLTAQSGVNGDEAPIQIPANTAQPGQTGLSVEIDPAKQESENNPNNDSEVIQNTPVVSEAAAVPPSTPESAEEKQAEPIIEEPVATAPEAEELKAVNTAPNIPSKLTRPTQVYAVEEKETTPVAKKENEKNEGFTPSSEQVGNSAVTTGNEEPENNTPEEKAANAEQLPVINNEAVVQPSEIETAVVTATLKEETPAPAVEEPAQTFHAVQEQTQPAVAEVNNTTKEDEDFISDDPGHGVNFNTPEPEPELPKKSTRGRKSLKTLDAEASAMNIPEDSTLFKRQYYSIGEVAGMFGVNQSLLRFWENEFDIIQPRKNRKGDRHFRPVDIKNLELIYDLLRRRKLTIEGAKEFLKKNKQARERFEMIQSLQQIKGFLLEIKASL